MGNTVNLEFAGDATKLTKASEKASTAVEGVGDSATSASDDFKSAGKDSGDFTSKLGSLGTGISGVSGAFDDAGGVLSSFSQIQNASRERAQQQKRALVDVQQAQEDYNQALRDGKQAAIDTDQAELDLKQARLDQVTALTAYNQAVKEHGKNSAEASQAQIDLAQAGIDVKQANEDAAQATRDAAQSTIDASSAQLDLNDAQREAHPPDLEKWGQQVETFTPLLSGLTGVIGLVTIAQTGLNLAFLASPITWIVVGIGLVVAAIVLIATKTDWFQRAWRASWGWIKDAAGNTWDFLKKIPGWIGGAFSKVASFISAPFRAAFNFVSDAWNNTVGKLNWTVPGWVPGIGGNSIGVPHLPHFHSGGVVGGPPGSDQLAVLQAGERVTPATSSGGQGDAIVVASDGSSIADALIEILAAAIGRRGGNVQLVLGSGRG